MFTSCKLLRHRTQLHVVYVLWQFCATAKHASTKIMYCYTHSCPCTEWVGDKPKQARTLEGESPHPNRGGYQSWDKPCRLWRRSRAPPPVRGGGGGEEQHQSQSPANHLPASLATLTLNQHTHNTNNTCIAKCIAPKPWQPASGSQPVAGSILVHCWTKPHTYPIPLYMVERQGGRP